MDFIIDTQGDTAPTPENLLKEDVSTSESLLKNVLQEYKLSLSHNDPNLVTNVEAVAPVKKKTHDLKKEREINALLKKSSILSTEFEQLHSIPEYDVSKKRLREQRKLEREKTKGKKWFNMPATEMTEEIKHDLQVLQMRSALNPKHFYKKNDLKVLPKYFQVGKVLDSPLDYYNRIPQKDRKKTLVDELLADAEFNKYNKRKYKEIIDQRQKTHYKAWRQAKRLKKKNKK